MRTTFIKTLSELAEQDERIWLLCGDLGYSVLEDFASKFPDRYLNVGVAEQNMTGIAAGLAMSGKTVFTYSIANFPTLRCLEQIRNDVCYHNANVKIISVGGGYTYGTAGYTHHGVEDIAVMRVLPNMTVIAPGDPVETRLATTAIASTPGPCYLRLGKAGEPIVHEKIPDFQIGKIIKLKEGNDIALISTGGMLQTIFRAAIELEKLNYSVAVISVPTISPLDEKAILDIALSTQKLITVEEHGIGGLGSAVAEILAINKICIDFTPLRLPKEAVKIAGSQDFLLKKQHLSIGDIIEAAKLTVGKSG